MKTLKTFLTAIMLCLSLSVMGQEVNLLLEDHLENMAEDNESADWDEVEHQSGYTGTTGAVSFSF